MDIAALSMGLSQTRVLNEVGTAVLAKSLDTMESSGEQMVDMMKSSITVR